MKRCTVNVVHSQEHITFSASTRSCCASRQGRGPSFLPIQSIFEKQAQRQLPSDTLLATWTLLFAPHITSSPPMPIGAYEVLWAVAAYSINNYVLRRAVADYLRPPLLAFSLLLVLAIFAYLDWFSFRFLFVRSQLNYEELVPIL